MPIHFEWTHSKQKYSAKLTHFSSKGSPVSKLMVVVGIAVNYTAGVCWQQEKNYYFGRLHTNFVTLMFAHRRHGMHIAALASINSPSEKKAARNRLAGR